MQYLSFSDLLHLAYLPSASMLLQKANFHSFLWLSSIPSCNIYPIFFIHLSVDIGCSHILAIADNAAMNIGFMYLFELVFLFFSR